MQSDRSRAAPENAIREDRDGADSAPQMKTAVVIIHGMGEQRPMDTLRDFVEAVWTRDRTLTTDRTNDTFSKPDKIIGSFELRRITTRPWSGDAGRRVDFFEFYWAHLMTGNKITHVLSWALRLFIRSPATVPKDLLIPWMLGLALIIVSMALDALALLPQEARSWLPNWLQLPHGLWFIAALMALLSGLVQATWITPVVGDAARYLSPTPNNVAVRQAIREAGVDLLNKLSLSAAYDRIVVAGHSLGSVIGYDILNYAWARIDKEAFFKAHKDEPAAMAALDKLERAAGALGAASAAEQGASRTAFRVAQRAYFAALSRIRVEDQPLWLVSDFVSMGSPLSRADLLLAQDATAFERLKILREAPTCPPQLEKQKPPRFSFPLRDPVRAPHHASVFGPTIWTNLFFENRLIVLGDFIGGPLRRHFGAGVRDVRIAIGGIAFRHLDYWKTPAAEPAESWIKGLRRAINMRLQPENALWGDQTDAAEVVADNLS